MSADMRIIDSLDHGLVLDPLLNKQYKFIRILEKFHIFDWNFTHQEVARDIEIADLLSDELRDALALQAIAVTTLYNVVKSLAARKVLVGHMDAGNFGMNAGGQLIVDGESNSLALPTDINQRTVVTQKLIDSYFATIVTRSVRPGKIYRIDKIPAEY